MALLKFECKNCGQVFHAFDDEMNDKLIECNCNKPDVARSDLINTACYTQSYMSGHKQWDSLHSRKEAYKDVEAELEKDRQDKAFHKHNKT